MNENKPRFGLGDLVTFSDPNMISMTGKVAIVVSPPQLVFKNDWPIESGWPTNFWNYTINIDGKIYKNIPEEFLKELNDETEREIE